MVLLLLQLPCVRVDVSSFQPDSHAFFSPHHRQNKKNKQKNKHPKAQSVKSITRQRAHQQPACTNILKYTDAKDRCGNFPPGEKAELCPSTLSTGGPCAVRRPLPSLNTGCSTQTPACFSLNDMCKTVLAVRRAKKKCPLSSSRRARSVCFYAVTLSHK